MYFTELVYSNHGTRIAKISLSLDDAINDVIDFVSEDDPSEELRDEVRKLIDSPNILIYIPINFLMVK